MRIHTKTRILAADLDTPVSIYLKIRDLYPQSALLESSDYHTSQNSVSLIGIDPIGAFKVIDGKVRMTYPDGSCREMAIGPGVDVIDRLREYIQSFEFDGNPSATNGLLGFTAYDAVRYFESVDIKPREESMRHIPDMCYIFYRYILALNHYKSEMTISENLIDRQTSGIDQIVSVLHNNNIAQYAFHAVGDIEASSSPDQFMAMVERGVRHCRRGDVFQIVPSRRFSQSFTGDEFQVYRSLRSVNPSPYLFYFDFGSFKVFGSSPETHFRVEGRNAYIDPIAGTFRRTGDDRRDRELARELLADEKENAEHIMLVDLARNDLSRSGGKVSIEFLRQIQYYSHVIHMVSRVKAELPEGVDVYRLFANTFPAGTLTGAPKVRAMQLIDEMEPHSRVTYGGCIGYLGFNGNINQAITIRSFLSHNGRLYYQAGAGVVAHSDPAKELRETDNKLGALNQALNTSL